MIGLGHGNIIFPLEPMACSRYKVRFTFGFGFGLGVKGLEGLLILTVDLWGIYAGGSVA